MLETNSLGKKADASIMCAYHILDVMDEVGAPSIQELQVLTRVLLWQLQKGAGAGAGVSLLLEWVESVGIGPTGWPEETGGPVAIARTHSAQQKKSQQTAHTHTQKRAKATPLVPPPWILSARTVQMRTTQLGVRPE